MKNIKDKVKEEYAKGNVVVRNECGIQSQSMESFLKQPIEGILYDLNRNEAVIMAFVDDPKWVNDLALTKVLIHLYGENERLRQSNGASHTPPTEIKEE